MKNFVKNFRANSVKKQKVTPIMLKVKSMILDSFLKKFMDSMNSRLAKHISMEKLHSIFKVMAKGNSLDLDGVVAEFYTFFYEMISLL